MTQSISDRERAIVEQVVRDRLASNESIQERFLQDCHPTITTRITARLVKSGWLNAYPLIYPTKYFVPGKRAAAAYGLSSTRTLPLGPQSLPTEYAILQYSSKHRDCVTRATTSELPIWFPEFSESWLHASYCLRASETSRVLELIRVDLGGPADHVARKCRQDVDARHLDPCFSRLIESGGFAIVVVTGSTTKAAAVKRALDGHVWPTGVAFRLSTFVGLLQLLPRTY